MLMPNVRGPREKTRRLYLQVMLSMITYAVAAWGEGRRGVTPNRFKPLAKMFRRGLLRVTFAYRTTAQQALELLAGMPPIDLLVGGRIKKWRASRLDRLRIEEEDLREWENRLNPSKGGAWTLNLIGPYLERWTKRRHGELNFHLTQILGGHGSFGKHLERIGKKESAACEWCSSEMDDAAHTLLVCPAWEADRRRLEMALGHPVGRDVVGRMLESEESWMAVSEFCSVVMRKKEDQERERDRRAQGLERRA